MAVKIEPLLDRIIVKPVAPKEISDGGLHIPDLAQERPNTGVVLSVGPGRGCTTCGTIKPIALKVGMKVLYSQFNGIKVEVDRVEVLILLAEDILGTLEE